MVIGVKEQARDRVRDLRIDRIVELVPPGLLLEELPLGEKRESFVVDGRGAVADVLRDDDDRLLVVVGPCSVHDADAALEYGRGLAKTAKQLDDDLLIVMRVYFEKPRTTTGWKGLINDPRLDGSFAINEGLRKARHFLLDLASMGVPVGCEFLDPISPQYTSDTVSWGAIGARTTESQVHRELASGLSMPIGFKNRTDGDVQVAVDAVRAAGVPHVFAGIDDNGAPAILHTTGNPDCHVILRGGKGAPNYGPDGVSAALEKLRSCSLPERLVIDASHDNSAKDPARQETAAAEIAEQVGAGNRAIVGVMLESFLVAGRQDLGDGSNLTYGQSITDACMDWEQTAAVLDGLAAAARTRREG